MDRLCVLSVALASRIGAEAARLSAQSSQLGMARALGGVGSTAATGSGKVSTSLYSRIGGLFSARPAGGTAAIPRSKAQRAAAQKGALAAAQVSLPLEVPSPLTVVLDRPLVRPSMPPSMPPSRLCHPRVTLASAQASGALGQTPSEKAKPTKRTSQYVARGSAYVTGAGIEHEHSEDEDEAAPAAKAGGIKEEGGSEDEEEAARAAAIDAIAAAAGSAAPTPPAALKAGSSFVGQQFTAELGGGGPEATSAAGSPSFGGGGRCSLPASAVNQAPKYSLQQPRTVLPNGAAAAVAGGAPTGSATERSSGTGSGSGSGYGTGAAAAAGSNDLTERAAAQQAAIAAARTSGGGTSVPLPTYPRAIEEGAGRSRSASAAVIAGDEGEAIRAIRSSFSKEATATLSVDDVVPSIIPLAADEAAAPPPPAEGDCAAAPSVAPSVAPAAATPRTREEREAARKEKLAARLESRLEAPGPAAEEAAEAMVSTEAVLGASGAPSADGGSGGGEDGAAAAAEAAVAAAAAAAATAEAEKYKSELEALKAQLAAANEGRLSAEAKANSELEARLAKLAEVERLATEAAEEKAAALAEANAWRDKFRTLESGGEALRHELEELRRNNGELKKASEMAAEEVQREIERRRQEVAELTGRISDTVNAGPMDAEELERLRAEIRELKLKAGGVLDKDDDAALANEYLDKLHVLLKARGSAPEVLQPLRDAYEMALVSLSDDFMREMYINFMLLYTGEYTDEVLERVRVDEVRRGPALESAPPCAPCEYHPPECPRGPALEGPRLPRGLALSVPSSIRSNMKQYEAI